MPAAFGRLCVETLVNAFVLTADVPAAFGRLCVETRLCLRSIWSALQPPSGGCVLKLACAILMNGLLTSRLRAAVC